MSLSQAILYLPTYLLASEKFPEFAGGGEGGPKEEIPIGDLFSRLFTEEVETLCKQAHFVG